MRAAASAIGVVALLCAACVAPSRSYYLPNSTRVEQIDYSDWDAVLRRHVHDGLVDYAGLAAEPGFGAFVDQLRRSRMTRDTSREERLAFYLNAYNAAAIDGILRGGSPETLLGRRKFFWRTYHAIGSEEITLTELEDGRIRPFGDARIHFVLVCASASCPELASEALVPRRLDTQLEKATRRFVNDPTRNRFDREARVAELSRIFEWYRGDFEAASGSVESYVARYLDDPELARALRRGDYEVRWLDYDWSLNGTR